MRACFENILGGLAAGRAVWLRCSSVTDFLANMRPRRVSPSGPPRSQSLPNLFSKHALRAYFFICVLLTAPLVLRAQTDSTLITVVTNGPTTETNAVSAPVKTNAPMEVRPTEIQSKSCQFFMKSNVFVYHDDVHIDNPQMKLVCQLLTVEAPKMTNGNRFNRATAETNVVIDWVDDNGAHHATADKGVYTYAVTNVAIGRAEPILQTNCTVVLTGNPVVTNSSGTFEGDPIIWDKINGVISSPNMRHMTINQGETNTSGLFGPPTSKPAKTDNALP